MWGNIAWSIFHSSFILLFCPLPHFCAASMLFRTRVENRDGRKRAKSNMIGAIETWSQCPLYSRFLDADVLPWGYQICTLSSSPLFPDPGNVLRGRLVTSPPQQLLQEFTPQGCCLLGSPCSSRQSSWVRSLKGPWKLHHLPRKTYPLASPPVNVYLAPIEEVLSPISVFGALQSTSHFQTFPGKTQAPASAPYLTLGVRSQALPRMFFTNFLFRSSSGWSYEFLQLSKIQLWGDPNVKK